MKIITILNSLISLKYSVGWTCCHASTLFLPSKDKFTCFRISCLPNQVPFLKTKVEEKSSEIGVGFKMDFLSQRKMSLCFCSTIWFVMDNQRKNLDISFHFFHFLFWPMHSCQEPILYEFSEKEHEKKWDIIYQRLKPLLISSNGAQEA